MKDDGRRTFRNRRGVSACANTHCPFSHVYTQISHSVRVMEERDLVDQSASAAATKTHAPVATSFKPHGPATTILFVQPLIPFELLKRTWIYVRRPCERAH